MRVVRGYALGGLLSNTWTTCPKVRDTPGKLGIRPDRPPLLEWLGGLKVTPLDGSAAD